MFETFNTVSRGYSYVDKNTTLDKQYTLIHDSIQGNCLLPVSEVIMS